MDSSHLTPLAPEATAWRPRVLVLDDEWSTLERIKASLQEQFEVRTCSRAEEALAVAEERPFDVVITDVRMPDMDGLSLVSELKARHPGTQYILMTAFSDIEDTISAIRLGVADYLRKPFTISEVRHALNRCLWQQRLRQELASLHPGDHHFLSTIIARDEAMREVCALAETVAATDATVLISGETGTGKGLLARAMHQASPRHERHFVEINCAAIPSTLIESELFGHERGSFTGAVARKLGRVEMAGGGTLLLDELGEMPLDMQAKLLRFLQSFHFERVGGNQRLQADVRVIASTNRDLRQSVAEGAFRLDLFYRLNVVHLALPPLRERRQDIPLLADSFLKRFAAKYRREVDGFSPRAYLQMVSHPWPGNVRELEHAVERSVILCKDPKIDRVELDDSPLAGPGAAEPEGLPAAAPEEPSAGLPALANQPLNDYLAQCERQYLQTLLARHRGRVGDTARAAGINPKTLYLKMSRHNLDKSVFRSRRDRSGGTPPTPEEP
jgi:DNA-binding NtrC family response regulator